MTNACPELLTYAVIGAGVKARSATYCAAPPPVTVKDDRTLMLPEPAPRVPGLARPASPAVGVWPSVPRSVGHHDAGVPSRQRRIGAEHQVEEIGLRGRVAVPDRRLADRHVQAGRSGLEPDMDRVADRFGVAGDDSRRDQGSVEIDALAPAVQTIPRK